MPRYRIAWMIGQLQQGQQQPHGGRIGQRVAAFFAGVDVALAQQVNELRDGAVGPAQHANAALGRLPDEAFDPLGRVLQRAARLVFLVARRRQ